MRAIFFRCLLLPIIFALLSVFSFKTMSSMHVYFSFYLNFYFTKFLIFFCFLLKNIVFFIVQEKTKQQINNNENLPCENHIYILKLFICYVQQNLTRVLFVVYFDKSTRNCLVLCEVRRLK